MDSIKLCLSWGIQLIVYSYALFSFYELISGNAVGFLLGWTSDILNIVLLSILELFHWPLATVYKIIKPTSEIMTIPDSTSSLGHGQYISNNAWQTLIAGTLVILLCLLSRITYIYKQKKITAREKTMKNLFFIGKDGNWRMAGDGKDHRIEKPNLFGLPDIKNLGQLTDNKNKAQKLMEKMYLPTTKEQILEIMKKVGANKMFVKGGKGAISGEVVTKKDIDKNSKSQSPDNGQKKGKLDKIVKNTNQKSEKGQDGKNKDTNKEKAKNLKEKTKHNINQVNEKVIKGKTGEIKKVIEKKVKNFKEKTMKDEFKEKVKKKMSKGNSKKREVSSTEEASVGNMFNGAAGYWPP